MLVEEVQNLVNQVKTKEDLEFVTDQLRILASNVKNKKILKIIDLAITKSRNLNHENAIINLLELKIKQEFHLNENTEELSIFVEEMIELAVKRDYIEGLALAYTTKWGIEKLRGNEDISIITLIKAKKAVSELEWKDYTYYICTYSFAVHEWLVNRDLKIEGILEECSNYFFRKKFYRSFAHCLSILILFYQQTQNKEQPMITIKNILANYDFLSKIQEEIQSIIHFFIGFSQELSFNFNEAEKHLQESQAILKPIYKRSIYSGYYLITLSYLTSIYALQGKLELASKQMKEVEKLIDEGIATKNLDSFNKEQMKHIFNLTKFYIYSRLQGYRIEDLQKLVQNIIDNIDKYHSNAMFFSEFLLNANLTKEQLIKIKNLNNPSTRRIDHIINFLIEKTTQVDEQQIVKSISTLKKRPVEKRMTYVEKAFADLLAAQEYYRINRFAKIYPLLKKYENNLHKIEVLELRIFMEAFIQVGAFKNGDSLGPALQYMAIKKCRFFGFSRLENKLLDYLNMQGKDSFNVISKNS